MPRLLNLGSLNIDLVYRIPHPLRPGETVASHAFARGAGGKGLNQSLAAARAGLEVCHAGCVGPDGDWLCALLATDRVDVSRVARLDHSPTGHAIILVADSGENSIVLHGGANLQVDPAALEAAFAGFGPGDWFLTQNETSGVDSALRLAQARGLRIVFNPAPMTATVHRLPLDAVSLHVVNETEAASLAGVDDPEAALVRMCARWPGTQVVITLGAAGAWAAGPEGDARATPPQIEAVDTTAAGDTFIGYLLAALMQGTAIEPALHHACRAAALSATRPGAALSIPTAAEVQSFRAP
jgi:ribokinase